MALHRVLVVDDEPGVRRVAVRALTRDGYEVHEAADGRAAIDLVRADPTAFDLVLLDLSMPRMTGSEALPALRAIRPGLPVVIMSGDVGPGGDLPPSTSGMPFLAKPFTLDRLVDVVRATIGGSTVTA